ncbi:MAG: hypothetical protein LAO23_17075 [Acidobacteriia bacterium]|nr:hypothetical protein [Terriglobia bacterium]
MASIMKCVHCQKALKKKTKDHVFPRSWYPKTTPATVQRWTVPSCEECNGKFGEMEKELFIRAAMCVGPVKAEAAGLSRKAVESLGVGVSGLSPAERRHRQVLKTRILKEIRPYKPGTECFPGFGPHPGFPEDKQFEIRIPEKLVRQVAEKIVRGCEYVLAGKRLVEDPYAVEVYFAHDDKIQDVLRVFNRFGPVQLGPGFRVSRAAAHDEPNNVMYKIDIWGTWTIYASIMDRTKLQ